ncbi:LAETG motif-containing sortase-dependent surface protein [Streptomyces sp. TRM49041]|uniref:LAETG motif-containing sortase-dependent surface protein n=1 Tax=Streptomyces sp. TRM49041 TaxID=2603216 RepID=UPI0011EDA77D|nr:LAETG motif-containing sortase-dependent surface protein [Streptomyces sp. TRM49041]
MKKHLSSRIALRSVVSAAAVLLTVVTPVALTAAPAVARPVTATAAATAGVTAAVDMTGSFRLGMRNGFSAEITNGSGAALKGQKGLVTVAYGKHVNARLEPMTADPSKIVVERLKGGLWERLTLAKGENGAVQATFPLPEDLAAGATVKERFLVTVLGSIPADADMGEFGVAGNADGTGIDRAGFGLGDRGESDVPDVVISGPNGRPELVTGGEPVPFTGKVTNSTGRDIDFDLQDFFFVSGGDDAGDLDPQHVTVERRDAAGKWVPVRLGKQDQAVLGNLDHGALKNGESRTYELRLGLTKFFPRTVTTGGFTLNGGNGSAGFDFSVTYEAPAAGDPDIDRELDVTSGGLKGVTRLKAGGPAREFTATITNKGNITQELHAVFEIAGKDAKRRIEAGEIHVEQYVNAAADGWRSLALTPSDWTTGSLRAAAVPAGKTLAPGESVSYKLRISATDAVQAEAFTFDIEAAAERSSDRVSLPFAVDGATGTGTSAPTSGASASPSATPVTTTTVPGSPNTTGEMAKTGSDTTTPLLIGATGVLVAGGAGALLIARRRAL